MEARPSAIRPVDVEEPLRQAPLALVVCQIKYETNLAVSDGRTARAVQEALGGRERYVTVEQISGQAVNVSLVPGGQPAVMSSPPLAGWRFSSLDGKWTVSLMPDFAGLETTTYESWGTGFGERLEQLVAAVAKEVSPAFEQRLGLRYINRLADLPIQQPADWGNYLSAELVGPLRDTVFGGAVTAAQQHLTLRLDAAADVWATLRHGMAGDVDGQDGVSYLLDIDVYRQAARAFDAHDIVEAAYMFRGYAVRLFQSSLDPGYLESLR